MSQVNERTERLIVRRLDGELSDEEALELDRELLRSPQARQLFEEYQRIDGATADVLAALVGGTANGSPAFPVVTAPPRPSRYSRLWWMLPAAVAAGLMLVIALPPQPQGDLQIAKTAPRPAVTQPNHSEPRRPEPSLSWRSDIRQANHRAGRLDRAVDQDLLYIIGDDGNIYVIDRQHIRTAQQPGAGAAIRRVSGDL